VHNKLHVAIIMDGNGRWAEERGLPRTAGHRAGSEAVGRVIESAAGKGIGALTLYAFSSDNWQRPPAEVAALFDLLGKYLRSEMKKLADNGIRLTIIGRRDRLPGALARAIAHAEQKTAEGRRLHLRIAIDYSSRYEMAHALKDAADPSPRTDTLFGPGDVDLLIRTGGEQRLSDFMLWECAYAELFFTPVKWPDFGEPELAEALEAYAGRQRRFGGLVSSAA
jgi:undecaprenyl diphosphate synthase